VNLSRTEQEEAAPGLKRERMLFCAGLVVMTIIPSEKISSRVQTAEFARGVRALTPVLANIRPEMQPQGCAPKSGVAPHRICIDGSGPRRYIISHAFVSIAVPASLNRHMGRRRSGDRLAVAVAILQGRPAEVATVGGVSRGRRILTNRDCRCC